ncbi:MAG: hypothetical protein OXG33_04380 [Chloroflexi bacterium]|nr:hypothetical protein [Chloroflexota bacterium]
MGTLVADDGELLMPGVTGWIKHDVGSIDRDAGAGDAAGGQPSVGDGVDDEPKARFKPL